MKELSHEKLIVYQKAKEFLKVANTIIKGLPKGNATLADQLRRASLSINLNIAEGAGKRSQRDRKNFYSIARGSALECGAIIDCCETLELSNEYVNKTGRNLLVEITSILSKMSQ